MSSDSISRRDFLKATGMAVAGGLAVLATPTSVLSERTFQRYLTLKGLDEHTAMTLVDAAYLMYPHEGLDRVVYVRSIDQLDKKAADNSDLAGKLKDGVKTLDRKSSTDHFLDLEPADQLEVLKKSSSEPFFEAVRGHMVVALYNQRAVWNFFGYEGPAAPYGGYLNNFNDITWLPK